MARPEIKPDFWKAFCKGVVNGTLAICSVIALAVIIFFSIGCASTTDDEFTIGAEIIGPLGWYEFCQRNPEECK